MGCICSGTPLWTIFWVMGILLEMEAINNSAAEVITTENIYQSRLVTNYIHDAIEGVFKSMNNCCASHFKC